MKRMLSLALAGVMLASLAACGGKEPSKSAGSTPPANSGDNTSTVEPVKTPEPAPESNGLNADNLKLYQKGYFNDGVALITFKDEALDQGYAGLIDTNGKLQFYAEHRLSEQYPSHVDGYNYFFNNTSKTLYVLDNDFTVLTSYSLNTAEEESVVSRGGGYFVTHSKNAGFDASSPYIYRIYDSTGKEINSLPTSLSSGRAGYKGHGVFNFDDALYFAKSDTWLNDAPPQGFENVAEHNYFTDSLLLYRYNRYDKYDYVDDQGVIQTVSMPAEYAGYPFYLGETNGIMLFQAFELDPQVIYDTKSGQFKEYQGVYADRLLGLDRCRPQFHNGILGMPLRGGDDQIYTVLLNENLEELCEPVLGEPFSLRDNCFYTKSDSELIAYDLQGKELYRTNESPNGTPPFWCDGKDDIMPAGDGYFRSDGTEIKIDYSTGKLVTLPE